MCNNVLCARTENRKRIEKISTEYYHLRCLQLSLRARSLYLCFCLCLAFHIAFCLSSFPLRVPDCCYCYCYYFLSCFLCSYHGARHSFFFNLKSNLVCVFFPLSTGFASAHTTITDDSCMQHMRRICGMFVGE